LFLDTLGEQQRRKAMRCFVNSRGRSGLPSVLVVSFALGLLSPRPVAAEGGVFGFFEWLLQIMAADEVPAPLVLTAPDREAIRNIELLLREQDPEQQRPMSAMIMGLMAAARRDVRAAERSFRRAAARDEASPLPLTALAQTFLQEAGAAEGDRAAERARAMAMRAVSIHTEALERASLPGPSAGFLTANSQLDLAVACELAATKADPRGRRALEQRARGYAEKAVERLQDPAIPPTQRAFGMHQAGVVQHRVFGNTTSAVELWRKAAEGLRDVRRSESAAGLAVRLNLDLAAALPDAVERARYLAHAEEATDGLSASSRGPARKQVLDANVRIATDMTTRDTPVPQGMKEQLKRLEPEIDKDANVLSLHLKSRAIRLQSRFVREREPNRAAELDKAAEEVDKAIKAREIEAVQRMLRLDRGRVR
jgi:hypothetical protein